MTNSFRGGTGKSTIISNLAYNLATLGKKVVIIDSDIISPGVHALFGLDKKSFTKTLTDYLTGNSDIMDAMYDISDSIGLPDESLFLIPSSITETNIVELLQRQRSLEKLGKGLSKLKEEFEADFILIDTHPGLNEEFLVATGATDILLNVIRPDNQDYQGAQVAAEVSRKVKLKTYLIINKVHDKINKNKLKRNVEDAFGLPVAATLPLSEDVILSQSRFIFTEKYPGHKFSKGIWDIAENVLGLRPKAHLEIMRDILLDISEGKLVSRKQFAHYIDKLLKEQFIKEIKDKKPREEKQKPKQKEKHEQKQKYIITEKGKKYLKKYKTIRKFVDNFRL